MNAIQITQALKVISTSSIIVIIDQKYTNGTESGGRLLTWIALKYIPDAQWGGAEVRMQQYCEELGCWDSRTWSR